jgi:hypothetical protein
LPPGVGLESTAIHQEALISFWKKLFGVPEGSSGEGPSSGPARVIPVNCVAAEYAYIQADRCGCGGAWEKLGRVSDYNQLPHHITDHFRLKCRSCGRLQPLAFEVDVNSPEYEGGGLLGGRR